MSELYTAAIVGCGSISHAHADGYMLAERVNLTAVVDPVEAARRQFMSAYDVPYGFDSIEQMAEQMRPDLMSICTWHPLHAELTEAAAGLGPKGIICEKPMAVNLGETDRMIAACDKAGTRLAVGHQRRFSAGWEKGRELMAAGAIGKPVRVDCNSGDGLLNCGTHVIDGSRFILGDPPAEWVMGAVERTSNRFERDTPIEDSCMGLIQMQGGEQVFVQSDLKKEGRRAGGFLVVGSEGMMDVSENQVTLLNDTTKGWLDLDLGADAAARSAIGGETNAQQVRELVAWIEGGSEHRGAAAKARDTVEIMMALYESARCHRVVHLPLMAMDYPLARMLADGVLTAESEAYDIRGFLKWDAVDEAEYARLRASGKGHGTIMRELNPDS